MVSWLLFFSLWVGLFFIGSVYFALTTLKFSLLERLTIFPVVGFVTFALVLYVSSLFQLDSIPLIYGLIFLILGIFSRRNDFSPFNVVKIDWVIGLIILVGVLSQLYLVFPNGILINERLNFYGVNAHDGMWHVALMQTLHQLPRIVPSFAFQPLQGYHYLIDLVGNFLSIRFRISPFDLTFRILPLFFSVYLGLSSLILLKGMTSNRLTHRLGVFLVYFGGSFGFLLSLFRINPVATESAFWSQQNISTFINLPLGVSFVVLTVIGVLILKLFKHSADIILWSITAILVGALVALKAYGGVLASIAFLFVIGYSLLKSKNLLLIFPLLISMGTSLMLIYTTIDENQSAFVFTPGSMLSIMMTSPDRVNLPQWQLLMDRFSQSHVWVGQIFLWLLAMSAYVLGNFGIRLLGIISIKRTWQENKYVVLFFVPMIVGGLVAPLVFMQRGTGWNIIQFMYYSLLFFGYFAALALPQLKLSLQRWVTTCIVVVSLMSSGFTLYEYTHLYIRQKNVFSIDTGEYQALQYLSSLDYGAIASPYSEFSYVSAFSRKPVYYADQSQAEIFLIDYQERMDEQRRIFVECKHDSQVRQFLEDNRLTYIYVDKIRFPNCVESFYANQYLSQIFSNEQIDIYVRK